MYRPCSRICKPRVQILFPQLTADAFYTKLPQNLGYKNFSSILLFDGLQAQGLPTTYNSDKLRQVQPSFVEHISLHIEPREMTQSDSVDVDPAGGLLI